MRKGKELPKNEIALSALMSLGENNLNSKHCPTSLPPSGKVSFEVELQNYRSVEEATIACELRHVQHDPVKACDHYKKEYNLEFQANVNKTDSSVNLHTIAIDKFDNEQTSSSEIVSFGAAVYNTNPKSHAKERLIHRQNLSGNKNTTTLNLGVLPFTQILGRSLASNDVVLVTLFAIGPHGKIVGYGDIEIVIP